MFQVSLPACLLISEVDLCALLGNALDNAMEAAEKSGNPVIHVRCRVEKGLFMLQVENALAGDETPDLATTKADKTAHGFGLPGMREIAQRYGGSLEASADMDALNSSSASPSKECGGVLKKRCPFLLFHAIMSQQTQKHQK